MTSSSRFIFGAERPPSSALHLRAGPLTLLFETQSAFLRQMRLCGVEVIRGIYAAVRDRHWGTVPPRVENLRVESMADGFTINFDVHCKQNEIEFYWHGEIIGAADGTVVYRFDGQARSTFLRNRIGFCLLHPLQGCAGRPFEIEHPDGRVERVVLPLWVSPHQPCKRVRAMSHKPVPGWQIKACFEGDEFEMEDQRNWTDASFKTYCTPLELPFPAWIEKGTRIQQSVLVRLLREAGLDQPQAAGPVIADSAQRAVMELRVDALSATALPSIGFGMASHGQPLSAQELQLLKRVQPGHLRADIHFSRPDWTEQFRRAATEADHLNCHLHLALFFTHQTEAELDALAVVLKSPSPKITLFLVFSEGMPFTPPELIARVDLKLRSIAPGVPLAAGTDANFAELNRHRPPAEAGVMPCFSINPQVHAFDNLTLMENLEAQGHVVDSARQFSELPIVVSPITLRPRFNAVAKVEERPAAPDDLPAQVDPRQLSLFAAAWTVGSLAQLAAKRGVHSLTYYETTGWRGLMESSRGSPLPAKFSSFPGAVFPIYHVFAWMAGFQSSAAMASPNPSSLAAFALFDACGKPRILMANLDETPLPLQLHLPARTSACRVRILDESKVDSALREAETFQRHGGELRRCLSGVGDLLLRRHAIACIDMA